MSREILNIVVLAGKDTASTRLSIEHLLALPNVKIQAVLLDTHKPSWGDRFRNLRRNIGREGLGYLFRRAGEFLAGALDRAASLVPKHEVSDLLRRAFPEKAFSLADLAGRHGFPILEVGNLNGPLAVEHLRRLAPDLGVVLGTRVLKATTFSVPARGCVNLHKGRVPDYRGMPPGFWELYDNQETAGVTVHFVDAGLDTGDVIGEDTVAVHPRDTPNSLAKKLDQAGAELLARSVAAIADGCEERRPQVRGDFPMRRSPTLRQRRELEAKRGLSGTVASPWMAALKTLYHLSLYYGGLFSLTRLGQRLPGRGRACVVLYHRVNDETEDELTASLERFAEHALILKKYYTVVPTALIVETVARKQPVPAGTMAVHFDDCYRDVHANAARILSCLGMTACSFVSSGYIDTDRAFPHDEAKCPVRLENLRREEVADLAENGFEIGAHTVNHVDLGRCDEAVAVVEVTQVKSDLEEILERPVEWFSYPFGAPENIRPSVVEAVQRAGYTALFSAYGGHVRSESLLYNLPRVGVSGNFRPLDLLMEIEGLSPAALVRWLRGRTR